MDEAELSKLLDEALNDLLDDTKSSDKKPQEAKQVKKPKIKPQLNLKPTQKEQSDAELDEGINKFFNELDAKVKSGELLMPPVDPEEAKAQINESVPQILGMMQSLLSKELLLPALSDLLPKFRDWMKKNSHGLNETDRERYTEQCSLIEQMLQGFEDKNLDDHAIFERNMTLMEKMQSLGSPPDELVVPDSNKCSIM